MVDPGYVAGGGDYPLRVRRQPYTGDSLLGSATVESDTHAFKKSFYSGRSRIS